MSGSGYYRFGIITGYNFIEDPGAKSIALALIENWSLNALTLSISYITNKNRREYDWTRRST